jgi:hypothetical protein
MRPKLVARRRYLPLVEMVPEKILEGISRVKS